MWYEWLLLGAAIMLLVAICLSVVIREARKTPEQKEAEKKQFAKRRAELKAMSKNNREEWWRQQKQAPKQDMATNIKNGAWIAFLYLILLLVVIFVTSY